VLTCPFFRFAADLFPSRLDWQTSCVGPAQKNTERKLRESIVDLDKTGLIVGSTSDSTGTCSSSTIKSAGDSKNDNNTKKDSTHSVVKEATTAITAAATTTTTTVITTTAANSVPSSSSASFPLVPESSAAEALCKEREQLRKEKEKYRRMIEELQVNV